MKKYGSAEPVEVEADEEDRRKASESYTPEKREAMLKEQKDADRNEG